MCKTAVAPDVSFLAEVAAVSATWATLSEGEKAALLRPCHIQLTEQSRSADQYGSSIRGNVRALWAGAVDVEQFMLAMRATVQRGLTQAWHEGAGECGIKPDELTDAETKALETAVRSEYSYIFAFGEYIEANSKANKGALQDLYGRVSLWVNRYLDITNRAKVMACRDQKLEWVLNYVRGTKESCPSCKKLAGQVRRGSAWERWGVRPQSPPNRRLACGGWKCGCGLVPTDKPVSRGRLPTLP